MGGIAYGSAVGGLLDPPKGPTVQGPRLNDLSWQQSAYGANIPRTYGTVALSGNVVWLEHNKLKEVVKKKKSGGKGGGGGTTTKTYTYFATFALMLCQGEVAGVRRIWCGDKLLYNAGSDDLETIIASNQAAKGWKLYTGTDDQLPDPRYEADVGVGNAPAFRGYTYIVFNDFALADYSNTLQAAQFKVEVVSDKSINPREVYRNENTPSTTHLFSLFTGIPSEICRVAENINSDTLPEYINVYSTGVLTRAPMPIYGQSITGMISAVYASGKLDYAIVRNTGEVITSAGIFSGFPFPTNASGFNASYLGGILYLKWASTGNIYARTISGPVFYSSAGDYVVYSIGDSYVYALAYSRVDVLDLESLEVVLSFPYSSSVAINSTSTYVSYDAGVIWILPQNEENTLQGFDASTGDLLYSITDSAFSSAAVSSYGQPGAVIDRVLYRYEAGGGPVRAIAIDYLVSNKVSLADVISAECGLSSLIDVSDIDVSLITQQLNGYRVSGGTIRSVIEPLQGAYPFDVVPSGYKIKFVPRGQPSVLTIPWEDLAANDSEDIGDSLTYSREMDSQLPQKVTITALSSTREYASATQSYERLNTLAVNVEQRDIPLVLSDDEIAQMSEKLLFLRWLERDDFDGPVLPPTYLQLEAADVVTVQAKFGTFELRLTEINYESDGRLTCKAKLNNAAIYTSNAAGAPGPGPSGTIPLSGPTLWIPLDIPVVDETIQNAPGIGTAVTGYTDGWSGAVLVRSNDGGQTYAEIQGYTGVCSIGYARGALTTNSCALIDQSPLIVDFMSGEPESITLDQMIAGSNYAAYGNDGRWEIVRFMNAVLQADGSYRLSGFVRGDKGSERVSGTHLPGDFFILLNDPDNLFIGLPVESISLQRLYRAVTQGETVDSASDQAFTYQGVNLKPLAASYPAGARNGSGDLSASWTRRSRLSSTWWWTGVVAPVGEASEAYEIDVMSGNTVKRTISSTSPAITYTAAQQTTDFGSAQASITLRIYQLSTAVGRGFPLEVTL